MPCPIPNLSRWFGKVFLKRSIVQSQDNTVVVAEDSATHPSRECHACTRLGVPAFHAARTCPVQPRAGRPATAVLDPRSKQAQLLNRLFLLARGVALAVDPLFFYSLSVGQNRTPCLRLDGRAARGVAVARTCVDLVHAWHVWVQFRMAYVSRESMVVGCGKLVWDPRAIARRYLRSVKGFWFDVFVILPFPQGVFLIIVPRLMKEEQIKHVTAIILFIFMFQFIPKVYHSISLMRRMQKVTGYIFGTIWWGFGLNLIAYFIASHVAGGCWYVLAIQRVASCLKQKCSISDSCGLYVSCSEEVCYQSLLPNGALRNSCNFISNSTGMSSRSGQLSCLDVNGPFRYGIYEGALPIVSSDSIAVKVLYPIFWGLMTLSTFGNDLAPTSQLLEVMFSICATLSGLMLFTLLIGNIQVFLHNVMAKKRKMQLRCRDMEWWMRRRQLPARLRQRVRRFERQLWSFMGGHEEMELIRDFPDGLRRDIKRFLCLDLVKKVPLFQSLDDLILDNICDRVKPLVFSKDEKIIREGDPVQRIVFIVRGCVKSTQNLSRGIVSTSRLKPGDFFGDELFSWCLRRPFVERLPSSSATFTCVESLEAFALESNDLRYVADHFRYKFANERLMQTARYYSSNWRTWAAVNIQLAWRRYVQRTRRVEACRLGNGEDSDERRLRRYAAVFLSMRPHYHLE